MPPHLDAKLREIAASRGVSLNEAAIQALAAGLGVSETTPIHHDLDEFSGTWIEDSSFDDAVRIFETVDENLWK